VVVAPPKKKLLKRMSSFTRFVNDETAAGEKTKMLLFLIYLLKQDQHPVSLPQDLK